MAYVIAEPCVDIKDKACIEGSPVDCICGACEPVCPVESIYYDDDLPDQVERLRPDQRGLLCRLGSPGGASKTGITENDPMAVKSLDRGRCGCVPASRREERLDFG